MNIRTELLNFFTGLILVLCGLLNLWYGRFEMGMNWIVFGSMYLVMGDYLQNEKLNTILEYLTDIGRQVFSWVGLLGSCIVFGYYMKIFLF